MSRLALNKVESSLLADLGWEISKTQDGPEFFMDFGSRQIYMGPVIKRNLKPMTFRPQAQLYVSEYTLVSKAVGWTADRGKALWWVNYANGLDTYKIEKFDKSFAIEFTKIMRNWALETDAVKVIQDSIKRRQEVRVSLSMPDFIDYAYLRHTKDLKNISLEERSDGCEYVSDGEHVEKLWRAIEVSKR